MFITAVCIVFLIKLLNSSSGNTGDLDEDMSEVLPTARVVGVLQRNWRDYVACFAEDEVGSSGNKQINKYFI